MRVHRLVFVILLVSAFAFAQSGASSNSFSIDNIDKSADPCVDFYQYACGNWMKTAEIPADRSSWQSFSQLDESNLQIEKGILEKAAAGGAGRSAIDQKIGDMYGSCMDEKAVNAKGLAPLKPELDRIAAAKDKGALIEEIAHLHLIGPNPLFNFYSNSDLHNADQVIANIGQGGLSLPDRDYYVKDDADKVEMRKHLIDYATEMFKLAGQSEKQADASAHTVLMVETLLAANSMERTKLRDPKNRDHKMTRDEVIALAPDFDFNRYFTAVGAPNFTALNVVTPDFFRQVNGVIAVLPLDALKTS